jgi:hypothetical protein
VKIIMSLNLLFFKMHFEDDFSTFYNHIIEPEINGRVSELCKKNCKLLPYFR